MVRVQKLSENAWKIGENEVILSPSRAAYARLLRPYAKRGWAAGETFANRYKSAKSIDEALAELTSIVEKQLSQELEFAAEDLASCGIYDVPKSEIATNAEAELAATRQRILSVEQRYYEIEGEFAKMEAMRDERLQGSGTIFGGGFSFESAARGIAISAIANGALGAIHRLANAVERASDNRDQRLKKAEIFDDPETPAALINFIERMPICIGNAAADFMRKSGKAPSEFDIPSADDRLRSAAIITNISAGRVPEEDAGVAFAKSISLNPFNASSWRLWLQMRDDPDCQIERAADQISAYPLSSVKRRMVEIELAACPLSTSEDLKAAIAAISDLGGRLGVSVSREVNDLRERERRMDLAARTFNDVVFATAEEAKLSEEAEARLSALRYRGEVYNTADEVREAAKVHIRSTSPFIWLAIVISPIPSALITLTKDFSSKQRLFALSWMSLWLLPFVFQVLDAIGFLILTVFGSIAFGLAYLAVKAHIWVALRLSS